MWITIRRLSAQNVNAAANPAAVGALPITALHGAVHAALRAQGHDEAPLGLIVRAHEIMPRLVGGEGLGEGVSTTYQGRVYAKPTPEPAKLMSAPNDPLPKMDFEVSLAIEVGSAVDPDALVQAMRMRPFCGGRCISAGAARRFEDVEDMLEEIQVSGSGLMLVDATSRLLARAGEINDSALAALVDLLADPDMPPRRKMAIGIGFRMLETPVSRPDSRDPSVPHAIAEPILGYAELHPLWHAEDEGLPLVWRAGLNRQNGYCTLKGSPLCL